MSTSFVLSYLFQGIPKLYGTQGVPAEDKLIHIHFMLGNSHWYAAEFDGQDIFFGYVILNGDTQNAEWGYFRWSELLDICVDGMGVEIDGKWVVRRFEEV